MFCKCKPGLPLWLSGKQLACQSRRCRFHPRVGKISWRRSGDPLQYSCLWNPTGRGDWQAIVEGAAKGSDTTSQINTTNKITPASPANHFCSPNMPRMLADTWLLISVIEISIVWRKWLLHMSFLSLLLPPECSFVEEQVSVSEWLLYTWQVGIATPVTLMISEAMLRPLRTLGRAAGRKVMRVAARPGSPKGGCWEEWRREVNGRPQLLVRISVRPLMESRKQN